MHLLILNPLGLISIHNFSLMERERERDGQSERHVMHCWFRI